LIPVSKSACKCNSYRYIKASLLEYTMGDSTAVWPDRFGVDIKSTPFLARIFRRLVAVCLRHGAVPIGGMATAGGCTSRTQLRLIA
jgi:malate synthase